MYNDAYGRDGSVISAGKGGIPCGGKFEGGNTYDGGFEDAYEGVDGFEN